MTNNASDLRDQLDAENSSKSTARSHLPILAFSQNSRPASHKKLKGILIVLFSGTKNFRNFLISA